MKSKRRVNWLLTAGMIVLPLLGLFGCASTPAAEPQALTGNTSPQAESAQPTERRSGPAAAGRGPLIHGKGFQQTR